MTRYTSKKFAYFCDYMKNWSSFLIGPKVLVIGTFRYTTYVEPDKNILEHFGTKIQL